MNGCAAPPGPTAGLAVSPPQAPTSDGRAAASDRFHMELLMEKLRTKSSANKNLAETSRAVRMAMLDKRWAMDTSDRAILQRCLDSLQHRIKVCSLQSLVERLECLSRQLGLKFVVGTSSLDPNLFISSDMFYLEILLEPSGAVKDVKIHHEGKKEQQSCEELVSCISRGDFADFTAQLEGLMAIYQLNAQKNVKCNAFSALTALESDLGTLSQLQACLKEPWAQVHKSPIGLVLKRRGGHALRLTYFISPYEIARLPGGVLTAEALAKGAGLSALLLLETSTAHRLQLTPLVSIPQRIQTNNGPVYAPLGPNNSTTLPARFILKLSQPMPVCGTLIKIMTTAGEFEGNPVISPNLTPSFPTNMRPLLSLVVQHVAPEVNPTKGLFVSLPDQCQCYFLTENHGLGGCIIESIPFTHPRQVPALIACLRQQALFNTIISSCVRPNSKQDVESAYMIEVSALSWQHITVSLEQPGESGMATLEIELPEGGSSPVISIQGGFGNNEVYEEYLARVLQCTLSVPLTVRALLLRWERDSRPGFSGGAGGIDADGPPTSPRPQYSSHINQNNFSNESHQNMFNTQDTSLNSIMNTGNIQNISNAMHNFNTMNAPSVKKSRKRKSEFSMGNPSKRNKPQVLCEVFLGSSSSNSDTGEESENEEDNIQSITSNDEDEDVQTSPVSQPDFISDLESSGLDPAELIGNSSNDNKTSSEFENSGDGEINELQDMDEMIRGSSSFETKRHKQKFREKEHRSNKSNSSLLLDLEGGSYMPPSVSITPIVSSTPPTSSSISSSNFTAALTGIGLEKRPGIEIIPISSSQQTTISSSLTIIPIPSSQSKSMDDRHRSDKKSGSNKLSRTSSSDRNKEKKKKKRRDDSMGPPDKLPPKQDPLTKPVSVSIKPADRSHSPVSIRSSSPNTMIRKFSPSPTHGRSVSITKTSSGSPNSMKGLSKSGSSSHHNSPRHSPVQCSPKHSLSGYSSPKNHGVSSPKHNSSSGSSGKPSMSTLKSAANSSPSGKSGSSNYDVSKLAKISSKEVSSISMSANSKDKERKSSSMPYSSSSSGSSSPKLKSSSVKLKQLDLSVTLTDSQTFSSSTDSIVSPVVDLSKMSTTNQVRNRKGSLSAVIDKLKSAQHYGSDSDIVGKSSSSSKDRTNSSKTMESKSSNVTNSSKLCDTSKTQEYMVKPSSDGMKITINKTRTKDPSANSSGLKSSSFIGVSNLNSSSSGSNLKQSLSIHSVGGTGSPKTHTGLKPGVISGPASKKPLALQSSKSTTLFNASNLNISQTGSSIGKNNSGILSGSSKTSFTKSSSGSSLSASISTKSSKTPSGSPKLSSSNLEISKMNREREKSRSNKSSLLSSSNDKSIFAMSKNNEKRLSPAPMRDDTDGDKNYKVQSQHSKEQNFTVEGLNKSLNKSLDTSKYQIPKLSARMTSDDSKSKNSQTSEKNNPLSSMTNVDAVSNRNISNETTSKLLDYMGRTQDMGSKYSFQQLANTKAPDQIQKSQSSTMPSMSKTTINITSSSPKLQSNPISLLTASKTESSDCMTGSNFVFGNMAKSSSDNSKELKAMENRLNILQSQQIIATSREESISNTKSDYSKTFPVLSINSSESVNQSSKHVESGGNKTFTIPQIKQSADEPLRKGYGDLQQLNIKSQGESSDILLDFSSSNTKSSNEMKSKMSSMAERALCMGTGGGNPRRHTPPLANISQSPSLSVHIVKSPAPSPMLIVSPHSNSPCITDDELMDEVVIGPSK